LAATALSSLLACSPLNQKKFLFALGALCCTLLLLFPTISASDDLQTQAAITEDSTASKRFENAAAHSSSLLQVVFYIPCGTLLSILSRNFWSLHADAPARKFSAIYTRQLAGRAPPALPLL
jgi:hypothetical protein